MFNEYSQSISTHNYSKFYLQVFHPLKKNNFFIKKLNFNFFFNSQNKFLAQKLGGQLFDVICKYEKHL